MLFTVFNFGLECFLYMWGVICVGEKGGNKRIQNVSFTIGCYNRIILGSTFVCAKKTKKQQVNQWIKVFKLVWCYATNRFTKSGTPGVITI